MYADTTAEATIVLHVRDVNEAPQFSRSHYSAEVSEGSEVGHLFYSSITAIDRDEVSKPHPLINQLHLMPTTQGSNAIVSYSITNISGLATADGARHTISEDIFTINSSTAELYVNSDLEREAEMEGYHYYEITVRKGLKLRSVFGEMLCSGDCY